MNKRKAGRQKRIMSDAKKYSLTLRDYQVEAVKAALDNPIGVISAGYWRRQNNYDESNHSTATSTRQ